MLKTIKIASPAFEALFTPELEQLSELFRRNNFELRMAGGAVRDLLMDKKPTDVDFASTATPTEMKKLFENEGIRMLHKKGEEHGTITCRINDTENFEITTLRIDVLCDGRRAEVKFITDWKLDAYRRDLTINSLFLDLDGVVYDYTGGINDIEQRKVIFVGNPVQRLQEDYLRILRYFRFFGRISTDPKSHNSENIDAIIQCKNGLKNVSGERIWTELNKILVGRYAADVIDTMLGKCGLASLLGLNDTNIKNKILEFQRVANANLSLENEKIDCDPATMLAALLESVDEIDQFRRRAKISNTEYFLAQFIIQKRIDSIANINNIKYFQHLILDLLFDGGSEIKKIALKYVVELLKYIDAKNTLNKIEQWEIVIFPVNGLDLMSFGVEKGKGMRAVLKHLFELWKKSDFQLTNEELMKHINDKDEIDKFLKLLENSRSQRKKRKMN